MPMNFHQDQKLTLKWHSLIKKAVLTKVQQDNPRLLWYFHLPRRSLPRLRCQRLSSKQLYQVDIRRSFSIVRDPK